MNDEQPLEIELHQYVDGALDEAAMERVEAYLARNPEIAARARTYLRQKMEIRAFADDALVSSRTDRFDVLARQLARRLRRRTFLSLRNYAAMALLFVTGWLGHSVYQTLVNAPSYAEEVVQAHVLSSLDPTEVQALSPERVAKLFARIGEMERLPDLRSFGYEPIGAQLVPSDAGAILHIPYKSAAGTYVSYFLLHEERDEEIPRHLMHRNGLTLAYWQHDRSHHAIAAPLPDPDVEKLAEYLDSASSGIHFR